MQLLTFLAAASALISTSAAVEFSRPAKCDARFPPFLDHRWEYGPSKKWADAIAWLQLDQGYQEMRGEGNKQTFEAGPGKCRNLFNEARTKELEGGVFICNDESDELTLTWDDILDAYDATYNDCEEQVKAGKSSYQIFTKKGSEKNWNMIIRGVETKKQME